MLVKFVYDCLIVAVLGYTLIMHEHRIFTDIIGVEILDLKVVDGYGAVKRFIPNFLHNCIFTVKKLQYFSGA